MKKMLTILIIFISLGELYADGSQSFELDLKKDLIIGSTSLAMFTTGYLYRDHKDINSKKFGWFDEGSPFSYNKNTDDIGTVISLSTLISLPFLIDTWEVEDLSVICVMYLESLLLSYGTKDVLKALISRPRPYTHRSDSSADIIDERDSYFSFPSGHTSIAFMTASFSTYVFSQGESSRNAKIVMGASSFTLATLTGVLRVTSGAHYPTDVIAGAVLGSGIGFFVPYMHRVLPENLSLIVGGDFVGINAKI